MPDATDSPREAVAPRGGAIGAGRLVALPRLRGRPPDNLPLELTSFIGREREVAEVIGLLVGTRLLTLYGPGGCGQTRLALRAAAGMADGFSGGSVGLADIERDRATSPATAGEKRSLGGADDAR